MVIISYWGKRKKIFILPCLFLLFTCGGAAQNAGLPATRQEKIDELQRQPILLNIILEYFAAAKLKRDSVLSIEQKDLNRFKRLFASNSKIWDDIAINPEHISCSDYAGNVYERMDSTGVNFFIDEAAVFLTMWEKKDGWERLYDRTDTTGKTFFYEIAFDKTLYNGLDENNQILEYPKGRTFHLEFVIRVGIEPEKAEILAIRPRRKLK